MRKYLESNLLHAGFIGFAMILAIIFIGLQPEQIIQWATSVRHQAVFSEAGGLNVGNDVTISGIKVGSVTGIELHNGDALVTFTTPGAYKLGSQTTAHIRTGSLLGERVVTLDSAGDGKLRQSDVIPITRTSSPYALTDALSDLSNTIADTDTTSLNQSLDTLSDVVDQIAPQLGPTFDGLSRLSRSMNSRDEELAALLKSASTVTDVLSERSQQLNTLMLNADDLLGVLNDRRDAIVDLLANISVVSQQLTQLVANNEQELAPSLERLNRVMVVLQKNEDNIGKYLNGFAKFQVTQGETVANGPYYNAFVPNLALPQLLQPFLDYAFGFRRGLNAGQPPDNAGPRSELILPYNGIPGGSR